MELLLSRRAVLSIPALASLSSAADSPADRAHRMLSDLRTAQRVPGMSAAVWKGGSVVWSESLGESDLENGARASSGTRFRIGSLSKLFTAAAAVRLNQAGQLDLD